MDPSIKPESSCKFHSLDSKSSSCLFTHNIHSYTKICEQIEKEPYRSNRSVKFRIKIQAIITKDLNTFIQPDTTDLVPSRSRRRSWPTGRSSGRREGGRGRREGDRGRREGARGVGEEVVAGGNELVASEGRSWPAGRSSWRRGPARRRREGARGRRGGGRGGAEVACGPEIMAGGAAATPEPRDLAGLLEPPPERVERGERGWEELGFPGSRRLLYLSPPWIAG
jgi:hypothetical protein